MSELDNQLYPDVVAATVMGDDRRYLAVATTNNHDTIVKVSVYWYIPEGEEPVLMIEIDDDTYPYDSDPMEVRVRIRRNDGLIFDGTPSEQEYKEG
jgi:hypothetical protein